MKDIKSRKFLTCREGIIILVILTVSLMLWFLMPKRRGVKAEVTVNGETVLTIDVDTRAAETFETEGAVIELRDGAVRVLSSDCPNQICVNTGFISKKGEKIVCLPKKLVIEMV